VDQCPECATNSLDLFQNAFPKLADVSKGIIDVSWEYVDCPITSPLQIHMKEGVSAYWFSAQAVNANKVHAALPTQPEQLLIIA
jgi:expansin (peptidoglycan-binding protein)